MCPHFRSLHCTHNLTVSNLAALSVHLQLAETYSALHVYVRTYNCTCHGIRRGSNVRSQPHPPTMATPVTTSEPSGKTRSVTLTNWKRVANVPTGINCCSLVQAVHWCDYTVFLYSDALMKCISTRSSQVGHMVVTELEKYLQYRSNWRMPNGCVQ